LCRCGSIQPKRLATFVWYLQQKPQRQQKQHVCDNLRCSISSMAATSTLAGDININSAHVFQRFNAFTSSSVNAQLERQHHPHLHSSSAAAQPQRSATVTARAFAAASFSSVPVCVFVSTSVEQQRTFQQQHTSRSQLSDQRHAPRLHFSFGVQPAALRQQHRQQQLQRFSDSATGDASAAATQHHAISASATCSSFSDVVAYRTSNIISLSEFVFSPSARQQLHPRL